MSQYTEGPRKCFTAGEAIAANLRVYISAATGAYGPTVSIAGAANQSVGVVEDYTASGAPCTVLLANAGGTRKLIANGVISVGNKCYAAASGEVSSTGTICEGRAMETTAADHDVFEVMGTFGEDIDETYEDDEVLAFGTGDDASVLWSDADADNHTLVIGLGDTNQSLHITDKGAQATDWNVAAETHPTVYIHSNTTPATDYVTIGEHDGTSASIDVVGGTTLNIKIAGTTESTFSATATSLAGMLSATESITGAAGAGIATHAAELVTTVEKIGSIIKTSILIDLTGLNSGANADDIIGDEAAADCHIGRIVAAVNGTLLGGTITCIETPAGGDDNIDLWCSNDGTGTEDTDIDDLGDETKLADGGDWTAGKVVAVNANLVAANDYLYLTAGTGDVNDTYTAGILLIELWGKAA
jgi:hypothetical protein